MVQKSIIAYCVFVCDIFHGVLNLCEVCCMLLVHIKYSKQA